MTMLIFILVGGWMTTYKHLDIEGNIEMGIVLFIVSVVSHIVFGGLIYYERDAYHKYHDFQGIIGVCYIILKLIMVAFCFYFYLENRPDSDKMEKKQKIFYFQIVMLGFVYLLIDPFLIITCYLLDEWNR